tara:strand:+ start:91 stop:303 length:213 start_codon:yes stop_codon:yes gene_type:complete
MKITRQFLREFIQKVITEAAEEGTIQQKYRDSFRRMISKAAKGGNSNSPPYNQQPTMLDSDTSGKHSKVS